MDFLFDMGKRKGESNVAADAKPEMAPLAPTIGVLSPKISPLTTPSPNTDNIPANKNKKEATSPYPLDFLQLDRVAGEKIN